MKWEVIDWTDVVLYRVDTNGRMIVTLRET